MLSAMHMLSVKHKFEDYMNEGRIVLLAISVDSAFCKLFGFWRLL